MIETVVHLVTDGPGPTDQHCANCAFLLRHAGSEDQPWPQKFAPGTFVGVRIDTTFESGFIVGYFPIGERELEEDERRCSSEHVKEYERWLGQSSAADSPTHWPPPPPSARHDPERRRQ